MTPLPAKPAFSEISPYWLAARDIYRTMRAAGESNPLAIAAVANADMESAFRTNVIGDHDAAYGLWQHHIDRVMHILVNTGIDLRKESDVSQCTKALLWEIKNTPAYAKAYASMSEAKSAEEASGVFCTIIEGAGAAEAAERREADAEFWTVAIERYADFFAPTPDP